MLFRSGDDHLNNAARQTLIYQAMDWEVPVWAHLPLIHGPDGAKLSKRHGAQAVSEFDDMGYLPETMRNYLAKLGWGHGDDEIFSDAQAIEWFDIKDVVSAPARLDWAKLNHINNHYSHRHFHSHHHYHQDYIVFFHTPDWLVPRLCWSLLSTYMRIKTTLSPAFAACS